MKIKVIIRNWGGTPVVSYTFDYDNVQESRAFVARCVNARKVGQIVKTSAPGMPKGGRLS